MADGNPDGNEGSKAWQSKVWTKAANSLWGLASGILLILFLIGGGTLFLVWTQSAANNPDFMLCGMALAATAVLRMISILVGAALCFAGVAISFFAHEKATNINAVYTQAAVETVQATIQGVQTASITNTTVPVPGDGDPAKAAPPITLPKPSAAVALSAYSPGIIAIIFGSVIIVVSSFKVSTMSCPATTQIALVKQSTKDVSGADVGLKEIPLGSGLQKGRTEGKPQ